MGKACRGRTKKVFPVIGKLTEKFCVAGGCSLGHTLIENPLAIVIVTYINNFWSLFLGTDYVIIDWEHIGIQMPILP